LTHYGFDAGEGHDLLDLVTALGSVDGIEWIRLLYAHPAHLSPRLLEGLFEVPKVARYLDMPVQHASPRILQAMRRPYSPDRVRAQLAALRAKVPGITLRSTVIVGFPGETERDFELLCRFVAEVRYDRLGIFTYSREPGTPAADLPGRPRTSTAERRLHLITELQMEIAAEHARSRVGSRLRVLVDGPVTDADRNETPLAQGAVARARSEGEALDIDGTVYVAANSGADIAAGQFVDVEIEAADVFDLRARPLRRSPAASLQPSIVS
jgi:ribosomal protein S12 methylthiotransferase